LNLVKHKGSEAKLEIALRNTLEIINNRDVSYVKFDFHKETKKKMSAGLQKLWSLIENHLKDFSYSWLELNEDLKCSSIVKRQKGVLRTNCMDCLDRTNVVQAYVAWKVLEFQLRDTGLITGDHTLAMSKADPVFRKVWVQNGNMISCLYASSNAMKIDVTMTGKRTLDGMLKDGWSAIQRYYCNNFCDGDKQDGIDLLLGNFIPEKNKKVSVKAIRKDEVTRVGKLVGKIFLASFCILFLLSLLFGKSASFSQILVFAQCFAVSATLSHVYRRGRFYINKPRFFNPLKDV
jgi:hypothetical protein